MINIRIEKLALAYGQMIGQLSELLNNIKTIPMNNDQIYKSLIDITNVSALVIHEIYYKSVIEQEEQKKIDILKTRLDDLDWDTNAPTVRIIHCLRAENIITIEDCLNHPKDFYITIPNFGRKSLKCLIEMLKKLNLCLKENSCNK